METVMMPSTNEIILRLVLAALLGSIIGLERERLLWTAGLRTHMLVCVGATLIMLVSAFGFQDVLGTPNVTLDPSRVAAQVVSGIGFLGAGTILLRNDVIRGLTTAASLWTVAAIGLAVGGGLYLPAVAATVLILLILLGLKPLENRLYPERRRLHAFVLEFDPNVTSRPALEATAMMLGAQIRESDAVHNATSGHGILRLMVTVASTADLERLRAALHTASGVLSVSHEESVVSG